MKLLYLSDLHLDINSHIKNEILLPKLISFLNKKEYDRLLIGGDISASPTKTADILHTVFENTKKPISFIPGNHDIYVLPHEEHTSWDSYDLLKENKHSLIDNPVEIGDYVLIGDLGWYDYSFGPSSYSEFQFASQKSRHNKDSKFARFGMKDPDILEMMIGKFKDLLDQYQDKKIILLNHFIPFKEYISYTSEDSWNFSNAYMGSSKLGDMFLQYENIEYVLFGHTHFRHGVKELYNKKIICNPLGYVGEWSNIDNELEEELEKCAITITL
jgi:putative phosphoesterase